MCRAFDCENEANWDIDVMPICSEHAAKVAEARLPELIKVAEMQAQRRMQHASEVVARNEGNREPPVVYYARIGNYIKIGTSTRLRSRLATLRVDEVLAIEPGGRDLEQERHRQFSVERIDLRRENFRQSQALLDHISELRARHFIPHWATLPRTSQITTRRKESA